MGVKTPQKTTNIEKPLKFHQNKSFIEAKNTFINVLGRGIPKPLPGGDGDNPSPPTLPSARRLDSKSSIENFWLRH